jgi:transcriptional regulator with XRE-family HTH domain
MKISEQIRVLCARLNTSQAELARLVGKSPQSFSAKKKRESFTPIELDEIAEATDTKFVRKFVLRGGEEI